MNAPPQLIDRFAELMAQDLPTSVIRQRLRLTKGQAAGLLFRIRQKLGPQAV